MNAEIIKLLKKSSDYLSGEDLSKKLSMSRAAVWKHIEELRRLGYAIDAISRRGYRLSAVPDKIFAWEIQDGLTTKVFGKEFHYHEKISSTMGKLWKKGLAGSPEGTVVCAETQTAGRGRLGRKWVSPGGGIYFSLLLRPTLPRMDLPKLTLMTAVALAEALREASGIDVKIKWPNDLLINKKKVAGILTELNAESDRIKFLIIGIGVNVNTLKKDLPAEATSFSVEAKKDFSRVKVAQSILGSLEKWYALANRRDFVSIFKCWKDFSGTLGQTIRFDDGQKVISGVAVDLAEDGSLIIKQADGKLVKKMSGDVILSHA